MNPPPKGDGTATAALSQLEVVLNDVAIAAPDNKDGGEVGPVGGCGGDPSSFFSSVSFPRRFT